MAVKYCGKSFYNIGRGGKLKYSSSLPWNFNPRKCWYFLTLENIGIWVNYHGNFYYIGFFSCCEMAVKYCGKSFYNIGRGGKLKYVRQ